MQDLDAPARIWAKSEVTRFLPNEAPRTREETRVQLEYITGHWIKHGFGVWAISLKNDTEFMGYCGVQYLHPEVGGVSPEAIKDTNDVELTACLDSPFWNQGFITEASKASLRFGFESVRLPRIVAAIHPKNEASRHIVDVLGMRVTHTIQYYHPLCPHFAMTAQEYEADPSSYRLHELPEA